MRSSSLSASLVLLALLGVTPATAGEPPPPCDLHNGTSLALSARADGKGVDVTTIGSPDSGVASTAPRDRSFLDLLHILTQSPIAPADPLDADTAAGRCIAEAAGAVQAQLPAAPRRVMVASAHSGPSLKSRLNIGIHHLASALASHWRRARHLHSAGV